MNYRESAILETIVVGILAVVLCLFFYGCSSNVITPPESNLTPGQEELRLQVLDALSMTDHWDSRLSEVPVVVLPREDLAWRCKAQVEGCAYSQFIYIASDATAPYCYILVHEYMHLWLWFTAGDSDTNHEHYFEFYTLPYKICSSIKETT